MLDRLWLVGVVSCTVLPCFLSTPQHKYLASHFIRHTLTLCMRVQKECEDGFLLSMQLGGLGAKGGAAVHPSARPTTRLDPMPPSAPKGAAHLPNLTVLYCFCNFMGQLQ